MISECSTLTSLVTTRNPTTSTTGTMMTERSTTTVCRHSHCQQSDNYGAEYGEKSAAAVTKAATFSAIVTAWRNHIFLNSRNSNTIDSNCCQGMALNSLRSSATKPPPPSSSSTTRSNQSAKTKGTTAQHSVLSSSASVAATVPLLLCQLDCMSEKTDRTTIERQKEIAAHAAQPSSTITTITTTTTTTITAYNEEIDNDYASDHYPNNVVECRIPLVNANNEYSGLATQHADETSRLKVFEMMATSSSSSSSLSSTHPSYRPGSKRRSSNGAYSGSKNIWWWQLVLAIYSLVLYISSTSVCLAARQEVASNCSFPSRWEGTWFLSGYQQSVHIRGSQFSYRGKCVASEGNKYLIVNDECHRCLVIYEKHKNVLQFKESECEGDNMYGDQSNPAALAMRSVVKSDHRGGAHPNSNGHPRLSSSDQYIMRSNDDSNDCSFCKRRETLQNLCDQIPGDALLYSLFRENAEPVECPLKGPFSFTYNRGHGECKSPVSNIESCTEDSRLLLSFQACPDVQGTESTVEELTCLATWKDGNSRYLIGLVSQHHSHHLPAPHHALSNEERYRCFVYEKISSMMGIFPGPMSNMNTKDAKYKLAQSGDATCNGLDSAEVGSRIMTLRKPPPAERCDFPAWFKAPRHWRALMGTVGYTFHQSDGSMHITRDGALQTRALCEQINKQTQTEMMAVVHYTSQCDSGFMCMTFYKRDLQVAEIQMGTPASRLEDACAPNYFDLNKMPFVTLLANSLESQMCPLEGLFSLRGAIGPPYITSRHKRNHNNKGHNQHGHHHHEQGHKRHGIQSFRNSEEFGQTSWQSHTRGLSIRSRRAAIAAQPTISGVIQEERRQEHLESGDSKDSSGVDSYQSKSKVFNLRRQERKQQQQKQHQQLQQSEGLRIFASETFQDDGAEGNDDDSDTDDEHNAVAPIIDISSGGRRIEINRMNAESSSFGQQQQQQQQRNRRDVPACMVNVKAQRQLLVGCTDPNLIEVRPRCSEDGEESYYCHGSWTENSTVYIIAKNQATNHGVCISYKQLEGNDGLLVVGDSCYRGLQKPPDNHFVANLTLSGKCGDTSSAYSIHRHRTTTTAQNWIQLTISPIIGGITVFCTMILLNFANS